MNAQNKRQEIALQKARVAASFRELMDGTEALMKSTASYTGTELEAARARLKVQLQAARARAGDLEGLAREKYGQASAATDAYVHENTWKSIGLAALLGLLIGQHLQSRGRREDER